MIEVNNLSKKYGSHIAVRNVSFTVNDGEILGFLGLNGAGKSTIMNIMTGYISPRAVLKSTATISCLTLSRQSVTSDICPSCRRFIPI